MATITLKYDARNSIARKTINYILSLGVFKVEKSSNTHDFKQALIEKDVIKQEIKEGKINWLTEEELLNEL